MITVNDVGLRVADDPVTPPFQRIQKTQQGEWSVSATYLTGEGMKLADPSCGLVTHFVNSIIRKLYRSPKTTKHEWGPLNWSNCLTCSAFTLLYASAQSPPPTTSYTNPIEILTREYTYYTWRNKDRWTIYAVSYDVNESGKSERQDLSVNIF